MLGTMACRYTVKCGVPLDGNHTPRFCTRETATLVQPLRRKRRRLVCSGGVVVPPGSIQILRIHIRKRCEMFLS